MNRKACFFSNLEYENFLTLEMNPDVEFMCEQPLQIKIMVDGILGKSVLDFWVKYNDRHEEIQEVKLGIPAYIVVSRESQFDI